MGSGDLNVHVRGCTIKKWALCLLFRLLLNIHYAKVFLFNIFFPLRKLL